MSTEDGPGLRTTVFLKGCSLACAWCHNPESMSPQPQVVWHDWKCIGSRACDARCPHDAIERDASRVVVRQDRCDGCGECVQACPSTALELLGRERSAAEVFEELVRDRNYYDADCGGVTVSGGEPGLKPGFVSELFSTCRKAGVRTALDTCGLCAPEALARLMPLCDVILYDIKEVDSARHQRFTGQPNERILENFKQLVRSRRRGSWNGRLWVRTPLIPGATATEQNVRGIGAFLAEPADGIVARWELCAFNNLARDKYQRLGRSWNFQDAPLLSHAELEGFAAVARNSGVDPQIVIATGATRIEESEQPDEARA